MITTILWLILGWLDNNHGYTTSLQKRFKIGDKAKISSLKQEDTDMEIGEEVVILETGRHDYLIENASGKKEIVYQFEILKNKTK